MTLYQSSLGNNLNIQQAPFPLSLSTKPKKTTQNEPIKIPFPSFLFFSLPHSLFTPTMASSPSLSLSQAILTRPTPLPSPMRLSLPRALPSLRPTTITTRRLSLSSAAPRRAAISASASATETAEIAATDASLVEKSVNTIRFLAIDAVEKANSGHPGLPMGCAPLGHVLYDEVMRYNPKNPTWFNRDRFVLSAGHGCMLQYALLHLAGYDSVKVTHFPGRVGSMKN